MIDLNETLAGMRAKTDAATPGPWRATDPHPFQPGAQIRLYGPDWEPIRIEASNERHVWATPDAEFIAMARTAMPRLLAAVESVLALHTPTYPMEGPDVACFHCAVPATTGKYTWVPWPCPTVRAIESALGGGDDAE